MEIKFSDESLSDLRNIEEFLLKKWNAKVFESFLTKLDEIVDIICEGNVFFGKYENTKYHKVLITKHNSLIYLIEMMYYLLLEFSKTSKILMKITNL
ncbi:hypothetical protein ACFQO9_16400 [Chryseobacterium zhengzhouense]|uniref:Type II toxin-antitoxin system RelE/ParE family toxin n=1 Tax=Chryseobacterium zhengzhouense TaxID=1636086 RepID=A0ABW2M0E1_9FLAO